MYDKKGQSNLLKNLTTSRRESGIFHNINFQLSKLKVNAIVNVIFVTAAKPEVPLVYLQFV